MHLVKTYLINLHKDQDRLKWMESQFKDFPFERFDAFKPVTIPDNIRGIFPKDNPVLLPSEQACFASHLKILHNISQANKSNVDYWLICEDDLRVDLAFMDIVREIPLDLCGDIIRLNDYPKTPSKRLHQLNNYQLISFGRIPSGTGSYLINQKGAKAIINLAKEIRIPYDLFLREIGCGQLKTTGIHPPPLIQNQLGSSSIIDCYRKLGKRKFTYKNQRSRWNRARHEIEKLNINYLFKLFQFKLSSNKRDKFGKYLY